MGAMVSKRCNRNRNVVGIVCIVCSQCVYNIIERIRKGPVRQVGALGQYPQPIKILPLPPNRQGKLL
jgi:hypothetical protein